MSRPRPLMRAEQLALDEGVESQDSQAILDALKAEFGAAALHGTLESPPQLGTACENVDVSAGRGADECEERHSDNGAEVGDLDISSSARRSVRWQDHTFKKQSINTPRHSNASNPTAEFHRVGREAPQTHQPPARPRVREQDLDDAVVAESSPVDRNARSSSPLRNRDNTNQSHGDSIPTMPIGAGRPQMGGAMDVSQQTPTQVNVERDYDQFYQPVESSSLPDTLHVDDTGAVNFGNLSPGAARPSSQVSEDAGFENTRGEWRAPAGTSQHRPSSGHTPFKPRDLPPETPVPPKNPFAIQNDANGGVPFAGTQLFEQTPALPSAMKLHSPTSSRPSPAMLPDTMSLNVMGTSPLKARANVSSPTVMHTSSPSRINNIPASTHKPKVSPIQEESLAKSRELRDDMIPESPTVQPSKRHENRQPLAHYEPMKKSQERKAAVHMPPLQLGIDSDSDDAIIRMRRKKRMNKIRLQTAEEMEKVTVQIPPRRDTGDSRNRKRRKLSSSIDEGSLPSHEQSVEKMELPSTDGGSRSSEKGSSLPGQRLLTESTKATPRDDAAAPSKDNRKRASTTKLGRSKEDVSEEMIPATSPVRSFPSGARHDAPAASEPEPELPVLAQDEFAENDPEADVQSSSLPPLRRQAQRSYGRRAQSNRRSKIITSSETNERASTEPDIQAHKSALPSSSNATVVPARTETTETENPEPRVSKTDSATVIPTAIRTLRRDNKAPLTPVRPRMPDRKAHTSSSFTTLSTPVASEKTTPNTPSSPVSDQPEAKATTSSSPAQGRKMRSRNSERASKDRIPQQAAKALRTSIRSVLNEPSSTDELQQSPSSSVLESGVSSLRSSRIFKQSIGSTFRGRRMFEGMAFAISMSLDKKNEKTRASIEAKIKQAGGLILESGFEELFEPSTIMSTSNVPSADDGETLGLSSSCSNYGFTVLIADTHSRKVKYMQALALGLPCLAYQWVVMCLNKGILIDWEPYLLAAGSSAILGNAIRSRCLRPYDAENARLAEVLDKRPKLLAAEKLLAVVDDKRARSEGKRKKSDLEKQPYLFLAQALGPSISWVSTIQQAREMLDAQDKAGEPFTWIYMDESIGTVESVLAKPELTGKKRRRSQGLSAARNVRVLCDELIVQSLILGRIAEEDEMYDAGVKS
ncbi:hypothetical protein TGAM01_v207140 [Trichoderma gamsii]|uniref:BRCT domain-containing protein n=1 Tax=Trichoderma gamsii TaxID=398673 RepID=A0A2P4ZIK7_9HYPO|nr:hypothetical protein TGAM01_v207140 [Trichoderma gamsii]PON24129.1 hypothetical protein TGAM01_v207140 [Trichoderma gamsii]